MFENFDPRARNVLTLAQHEARKLQHPYIGTEHLLLGVIAGEASAAGTILAKHGVGSDRARRHIVCEWWAEDRTR